ncbi:MAG: glycosyltransferase family 39 protein [Brumimicrobium sp.]
MKEIWTKYRGEILFIFLFVSVGILYYDGLLKSSPGNTHLWRQTDCLSLTRNYSEGAPFLSPEMDILLADDLQTGKTAGEFPILYWMIGKYWQFFGESHFVYRLFYLLILFAGLFAFLKSIKIIFKSNFWSITITMLLFTSPVLINYGVSFLTDAPAFSFILIALYFLLHYFKAYKKRALLLALSFFALAGLIKISSLIALVFICFIFFLEILGVNTFQKKKLFKRNALEWLGLSSVLILIFAWYWYASYYNQIHGFKYTFNNIFPFWLTDQYDLDVLLNDIENHSSLEFMSRGFILLLLISNVFLLFQYKKIPLIAYLSNIVICIGSVIYFLLWFPLMGIHEYYYVALLILIPAILIPLLWYLKTKRPNIYSSKLLKVTFSLFLIYNIAYASDVMALKKGTQEKNFIVLSNKKFISLMNWTNWDVYHKVKRFERMGSFLKDYDINENDRVISLPDKSFNVSLYFMNRQGWTNFLKYDSANDIRELIDKGNAKYLFISDTTYLKKDFLQPFLTDSIGSFEGIEIYKLSHE